jgi:endonuclease YncB( thermonuclease family)
MPVGMLNGFSNRLLGLLLLLAFPLQAFALEYDVSIVRVVDGDTITVRFNIPANIHTPGRDAVVTYSITEKIRIAGVNTPESYRPVCPEEGVKAQAAKKFVAEFLSKTKYITLVTGKTERDKYDRILGDLVADGKSLREELIKSGNARSYHGEKRDPQEWCK